MATERIVVVGAGFAGLECVKRLEKRLRAEIDRGDTEVVVVSPNDLLVRAYSSLPTRIRVVSRSRTTAARTFSRGRPGRARSASVRFRIAGNAEAKAIIRPYFDSSRTIRHRGW